MTTATKTKKARIMVGMPDELKALVEEKAKADKMKPAGYIRQVLATAVGYDGPLSQPRTRKYGSDEERKKARKDKQDLMRKLYEEHRKTQPASK